MPKLIRRITVSALAAAGTGTKIETAASVGGLVVPQSPAREIWMRQVGGGVVEWRLPALGTLPQDKLSIPANEVGFVDGVSRPDEVQLFLPQGVSTPLELQVVIDYVGTPA